jgi:cytidine deaminase
MNKRKTSKTRKIREDGTAKRNSTVLASSEPTEGIELVFGLVGPTGVDISAVCNSLRSQLRAVEYEPIVVSLSELIPKYIKSMSFKPSSEYERIKELMVMGSDLRRKTEQADIIGRLGVAKIRSIRVDQHGDPLRPLPRTAYIIRSFKRPEEVKLYRDIYGKAFTLISVYSPRAARVQHMVRKFSSANTTHQNSEELAVELINRDYAEEGAKQFGQRVGETFPLADYFLTSESKAEVERNVRRLIRLTFGDPYISPTRDEQGMFFAQASALRSLDLSRQVGAAIISRDGDLLSTGCNEVPKFGGGLYWGEDQPCERDVELGHDSNVAVKREIVEDAFSRMREAKWLSNDAKKLTNAQLAEESLFGESAFIRNSKLFDVIEFGRAVHAEMAAITQAAKNGVSIAGKRLFCTTFPCHICARHIVSSGIAEVVFIEPYEKSRTRDLYSDSISVEPYEISSEKANFRAFVGVAPRRYMELFQLASERKDKEGMILESDAIAKNPRIKRFVLTYLSLEDIIISETVSLPKP